ncbi:transcriptional regulator with XRE-family HTH domain [Chryseomicrobium aureum]|uniref:helix-turn-helix domain-containing protein n=1 Tax=Chryseomicrobium aureum TaxID=1441723 RepID=UPI0023BA4E19|nr:XRE family transcriptional regulator [Chryseomicrobium aureum]MBM7705951.1 transcriptional regulator with XRE-family HTH domain [Chryseomicrobium aureum]
MIGSRLKEIRKQQKMTLKELAEGANVSISFLSQVERGKSSVTLESLRKISEVLGVNPSVFFAGQENRRDEAAFYYKDLAEGFQNPEFHPILVTLQPQESDGQPFTHTGHEFVYVVEGSLTLKVGDEELVLGPNESHFYSADRHHYWYNYTDQPIRFLAVSSR